MREKETRHTERCLREWWDGVAWPPAFFWGAGVELVSMVDFVSGHTVGQDGMEGRVPQRNASL